jgi:hypothetical protein
MSMYRDPVFHGWKVRLETISTTVLDPGVNLLSSDRHPKPAASTRRRSTRE